MWSSLILNHESLFKILISWLLIGPHLNRPLQLFVFALQRKIWRGSQIFWHHVFLLSLKEALLHHGLFGSRKPQSAGKRQDRTTYNALSQRRLLVIPCVAFATSLLLLGWLSIILNFNYPGLVCWELMLSGVLYKLSCMSCGMVENLDTQLKTTLMTG